jgi:3-oxoacyl-[acyl-carrier protein] reductase
MLLADRVALITGAAGGIGAAITRRLLAEGAKVAGADLHGPGIRTLSESLSVTADRWLPLELDVTSEESCRAAVLQIEAAWGRVDIVINNAGIYPRQRFDEMTYGDWRQVVAVNLDGAFLVTRSALPVMKRQRYGRVINISSGVVFLGTPGFVHYGAAKAGLIGFSRVLASELGEYGITVNTVAPGLTLTETVRRSLPADLLEIRKAARALKQHQEPEHVTGAIAFLASDDAAFITGQTINVDGGLAFH